MKRITPVTAGGGVLFMGKGGSPHVLLIFRRGVWDLPKGKKEEEESVVECARREVSEEVGCRPPEIHKKLAVTYHEYDENGIRYGKSTHWYAMKAGKEQGFEPEAREGIERVKWFSLDDAKRQVAFDNLFEVLEAFDDWYRTRK